MNNPSSPRAARPEPKIVKRPAAARGQTELGWLHSRHSFSFGEYHDPAHMGFRSLIVLNDDVVEVGGGFGTHPHRDAEIFSYVIAGELEHRDSLGNGRIIRAGDLQYMSAGSGVRHSEFNPSKSAAAHFLQVWLRPSERGGAPRYAERALGDQAKPDALTLLFAGEARDRATAIRADAEIYYGRLVAGKTLAFAPGVQRGLWVQVIRGTLDVLGTQLGEGDGAAVEYVATLGLTARKDAEFLVFNLASAGGRIVVAPPPTVSNLCHQRPSQSSPSHAEFFQTPMARAGGGHRAYGCGCRMFSPAQRAREAGNQVRGGLTG
ncbi:MAG: pirin family protein [Verrucomicrobiota bacterium]